MSKNKYRDVYRNEMGIKWDGGKFDIHHINFDHDDNRIENLILIPKDLHRTFHSLMAKARFEWDRSVQNYILDTYMAASKNGHYYENLDWFVEFSRCIKEISIWGFIKAQGYTIDGKFLEIEGIWKDR